MSGAFQGIRAISENNFSGHAQQLANVFGRNRFYNPSLRKELSFIGRTAAKGKVGSLGKFAKAAGSEEDAFGMLLQGAPKFKSLKQKNQFFEDQVRTRDGVITVTGTTSSTEYATIAPTVDNSFYQKIRVHPNSTGSETFTVIYKKRVPPLVNDGDVPEFPCEEALFHFAVSDVFGQQRKERLAREHERRGESIVRFYLSQYMMQGEAAFVSSPRTAKLARRIPVVRNIVES